MIVEFMIEAMKKHNMLTNQGKHDFWEEVTDKYHISRDRLQKMYQQHEKDKAFLQDQKTSYRKRYMAKGVRRAGGGRKSIYEFTIEDLDAWVHQEYSMGHQMDKSDILEEWMSILAKKTLDMMAQDEKNTITADDKYLLLEQYKNKLKVLSKNANNRKETMRWLAEKLEMVELMPSRTTSLSPDEELEGCINTWGMWDRIMCMSACGHEKQLINDIADPEKWKENRASTIIVMEDKVPVWVKMGISKKMVPRTHARHHKHVVRLRRKLRNTKDPKIRTSFGIMW